MLEYAPAHLADTLPDVTTLEALTSDPHPLLAELRSSSPVAFVEALGGWLVTGYGAAIEVMRNDEAFTVDDPRFTTGQVIGPSMLSLDGPEHGRHRDPFVDPYRPRTLEKVASEWIASRARALIAGLAVAGRAELRSELAAPLAAETVLMTLALAADPDEALGWYRDIVAAVTDLSAGKPMPGSGPAAFAQLLEAVSATPGHDSDVIEAARAALGPEEVAANVAVVMFGAIETTEAAIANLFWHLLVNDALDDVRRDRTLLPDAIEESLRLEPAAGRVDRYASRETEIGDVTIPAGDLVIVSLTAANRDPSIFDDPDAFRLPRRNVARHLTFARGPHVCLGAHLARLEMTAAVAEALDLIPSMRLVAAESEGPRGLVFRKAHRVVVEVG